MKKYVNIFLGLCFILTIHLFTGLSHANANEFEVFGHSDYAVKPEYAISESNNISPSELTIFSDPYLRIGAEEDLDGDPNGQGPGIGTIEVPLSNATGFLVLLSFFYGIFQFLQVRKTKIRTISL